MAYQNADIERVALLLKQKISEAENKSSVLRSPELRKLYESLKDMPVGERAVFGAEVNRLKKELEEAVMSAEHMPANIEPIDVTAPFHINTPIEERSGHQLPDSGTIHPLSTETAKLLEILSKMGFEVVESPEIDDDYHMFTSLNFAPGHPARYDYDTFITDEGFIAPAHTSTMQNRALKANKSKLESGQAIAVAIPGRVFRNEDLDARHEHTFYQLEGVYVDKIVSTAHLISTLKTFLEAYWDQSLDVKTQPCYFPFTEPSFEFVMSCPFCAKAGCHICSKTGWIEILGCGMIHPNVLKEANIDPKTYSGFAWGGGIDRLVMMKHGIEDVRHFHSGNLNFLRQFNEV